jgi:hypothetical protein
VAWLLCCGRYGWEAADRDCASQRGAVGCGSGRGAVDGWIWRWEDWAGRDAQEDRVEHDVMIAVVACGVQAVLTGIDERLAGSVGAWDAVVGGDVGQGAGVDVG